MSKAAYWMPIMTSHRLQSFSRRVQAIDSGEFDVVMSCKDVLDFENQPNSERRFWQSNPRYVFDFDDAYFLLRPQKVAEICRRSRFVITGNEYLAQFAAQHTNNYEIIPTTLDTDCWKPSPMREIREVPKVGWIGTDPTLQICLIPWWNKVASVLKSLPNFEFHYMSANPKLKEVGSLKPVFHPWSEAEELPFVQSLDIGIMPLQDDDFQRGKCAFKLLQYLACGVPAVVSPVGMNQKIIEQCPGALSAREAGEWEFHLRRLLEMPKLRRQVGAMGVDLVKHEYSIQSQWPRLKSILQQVAKS